MELPAGTSMYLMDPKLSGHHAIGWMTNSNVSTSILIVYHSAVLIGAQLDDDGCHHINNVDLSFQTAEKAKSFMNDVRSGKTEVYPD